MKAENTESCVQRDSAEHEEYAQAQSIGNREVKEADGADLLEKGYTQAVLGYFRIASMKTTMHRWDEWLRRRLRMYIWKQWKLPKTRVKNLIKLGMEPWKAHRNGTNSKGYWAVAGSGILTKTITNERLARAGYYSISDRYESLHLCD